MKKTILLLLLFSFAGRSAAQEKPEKFSSEFLNCFLNLEEECAKGFISADTALEKEIFLKLKELYSEEVKNDLKGKKLTSSVRAVLKDGSRTADIFIQLNAGESVKYELNLWGCYLENGKWLLGKKIELKKA
jgi:hypothetical protein